MKNKSIFSLDTPAMLLDLTKLEQNVNEISTIAKTNNIKWRPHIKTHKSIQIAKMQMAKGACGITVAKLEEAEIMAEAGITNILIAYPLSNSRKLQRLQSLAEKTETTIAIDSIEQAILVNKAFVGRKRLEVWIKINSGLNRCGIEVEEVVELATAITKLPNLTLTGIFTHAGHSYAASSLEEVKAIATAEAKVVLQSAKACEEVNIPIKHRSIGSTPTFKFGAKIKGITEIRPGNAAFFDMCQVGLGVTTPSRCALTILASVVSCKKERIIFDTGSKALSLDQGAHGNKSVVGYGSIINYPEVTLARLSEEHGVGTLSSKTSLKLTDKVQIIPNHSCAVANLFDHYIVHHNGLIVDEWLVDARGKMK
ncbi:alanine racemase [Anaerobacillus alkalidiazotrophicus]|nr:alanine racemase [Anaerobacillus alkalidiazotrophicus]